MKLNKQVHNICYADLKQLIDMDKQCAFDLYNLMKRLEEFFTEEHIEV